MLTGGFGYIIPGIVMGPATVGTGGVDTSAPDANWQDLMGAVMNDPMLRGQFVDTRTAVQGDQKGLMYVTWLVRKP